MSGRLAEMVQFSPHNKHPVIVLRKEAWRIALLYPSAAKDSWGIVVTLQGGWAGSGHHEVSDCNNLRMQTWDLYIYTKGASTRWMRGSTGSCQYFYYCGKVRQNHHTHVRIMAVLGLW